MYKREWYATDDIHHSTVGWLPGYKEIFNQEMCASLNVTVEKFKWMFEWERPRELLWMRKFWFYDLEGEEFDLLHCTKEERRDKQCDRIAYQVDARAANYFFLYQEAKKVTFKSDTNITEDKAHVKKIFERDAQRVIDFTMMENSLNRRHFARNGRAMTSRLMEITLRDGRVRYSSEYHMVHQYVYQSIHHK